MPDPRFYRRAGPFQLAFIAKIAGADLGAGVNPSTPLDDIAPLAEAGPRHVTFVTKEFAAAFPSCRAGLCLTSRDLAPRAPQASITLVCKDPRLAFAQVAQAFYPPGQQSPPSLTARAADATIAADAIIEHGAVIGAGASIGAGSRIGPNAVVGAGVSIGKNCIVGAGVVLSYCRVGDGVILHPGVKVGQDGFGFAASADGLAKIPQLGRVLIEDKVEMGANCTVDRGALGDTVIGAGTKFDDMVHIGHNVVIGRHCILVAQTGVAGSVTIGDGVVIGGQVGIADHVKIGAGARIASQSGVMRDVAAGETVMGYPAKPSRQFWRENVALTRLAKKDSYPGLFARLTLSRR